MAKFEAAFSATASRLETRDDTLYKGICLPTFPSWEGWKTIAAAKSELGFPHVLEKDSNLQALVQQHYRKNFWFYDAVASQEIATFLFFLGIEIGVEKSKRLLQRAINYINPVSNLKPDGLLGPRTLQFLNASDPSRLLIELRARLAFHYAKVVLSDPKQMKFLLKWLRRLLG